MATGRKNKRRYEAKDEEKAIALAEANGLAGPFEVQVIPHNPPTDRQVDYLISFGATLPDGAARVDVSAMIGRLKDPIAPYDHRK